MNEKDKPVNMADMHPLEKAGLLIDSIPNGIDPEWNNTTLELVRLMLLCPHSSRVAIDAAAAIRDIRREEFDR